MPSPFRRRISGTQFRSPPSLILINMQQVILCPCWSYKFLLTISLSDANPPGVGAGTFPVPCSAIGGMGEGLPSALIGLQGVLVSTHTLPRTVGHMARLPWGRRRLGALVPCSLGALEQGTHASKRRETVRYQRALHPITTPPSCAQRGKPGKSLPLG